MKVLYILQVPPASALSQLQSSDLMLGRNQSGKTSCFSSPLKANVTAYNFRYLVTERQFHAVK